MVTQRPLEALFLVRVQAGQPLISSASGSEAETQTWPKRTPPAKQIQQVTVSMSLMEPAMVWAWESVAVE
jgi:hypothetical protein